MTLAGRPERWYPVRLLAGQAHLQPQRLALPLRWTATRHVDVCPHGELFAPNIDLSYISTVFAVMASAWWHQFLIHCADEANYTRWLSQITSTTDEPLVACYRAADAYGFKFPARDSSAFPPPHVALAPVPSRGAAPRLG